MSWPRRRRVLGSGVLLLLGATLCLAAWILAEDPRGWVLAAPPPATIAIYDRNGSLLYEALDPLHGKASPVSLRDLPPHLLHATIATEDASFYSNPGLDPVAILRALVQNWRSGDQVSGGSTLTQQLARNPWMRPGERSEPSLLRKIREALLAIRGAARLGKDEILELYLNMAPYGHQAIGVDAAARVYFGKGARDLDLAEAALLAGLPQAPSAYDPLLEPSRAKARQQIVLSLKPLLYATAMERGVTPATVLYDVPTSFLTADGKSYSPENYDRVWHGPVSAREALANSYNLPAVKLLQQVGIGAFLEVATRAGISTLASKGADDLSLALGSGEVRLLDLVAAYAGLATGGVGRDSVAILRVEDNRGRVLPRPDLAQPRRIVSAQVAYLVTGILSDDDARSTSFGRDSSLTLSHPAAAKTGTTTDWRDNWTVGYTPDLAAGVWVGNSDNSPMRGVSGISGAGPIWHDFMEEACKGRLGREFQEPPGLVRREVCPESGELPSPWCPNRRTELFLDGTAPVGTCDWHRPVLVDRSTRLAAGPVTPPERVEERVYLVVPPELQQWARERGIPEPPGEAVAGGGPHPNSLLLTSPSNGAVFQTSPELPLSEQRLGVAAGSALAGSSPIPSSLWAPRAETRIPCGSSPPSRARAGGSRLRSICSSRSRGWPPASSTA